MFNIVYQSDAVIILYYKLLEQINFVKIAKHTREIKMNIFPINYFISYFICFKNYKIFKYFFMFFLNFNFKLNI